MKLKPRPEGGAFPGKGKEVRERNLKASRTPAWVLRLERRDTEKSLQAGPLQPGVRGEAEAPGEVEGLMVGLEQSCSRDCTRFR